MSKTVRNMLLALLVVTPTIALADTCSQRASICEAACTPALVSSGQQYGGTVRGCVASCRSRLSSCLRTGVWVHMGVQNRGMRQPVDRR